MVTTRSRTTVGAAVHARAMVYVANELVRLLADVVNERGLKMDDMHEQMESLMKAFRTWMIGHWLNRAVLEIYDPSSGKLVERYDLALDYERHHEETERFETTMDRVREALGGETLDARLRYRVLVSLANGAPELPGWSPTTLREAGHLKQQKLNDVVGTASIGVDLEYWR